ncbi:unnamed protein product [Tilletia controversa]|nr:unnamed protein product [Tilletia controversa]
MNVDLSTQKRSCSDQCSPVDITPEIQQMLRDAVRPPEPHLERYKGAPAWIDSPALRNLAEDFTMWYKSSSGRPLAFSGLSGLSRGEKASYGSDPKWMTKNSLVPSFPLFEAADRPVAPLRTLPVSADLFARVDVPREKLSATNRLLNVVESADDISTLSVNTSQRSTSTEGHGRQDESSDSSAELQSGQLHSASCGTFIDEASIKGKSALFSLFDSENVLEISEFHYYWRPTVEFDRSQTDLMTSAELLRRCQVRPLQVDATQALPPIIAVSTPSRDLWKETLNVGQMCIIDLPDHALSQLILSRDFEYDSKKALKRVKLNPVLEVEMGATSFSTRSDLHHQPMSFTIDALGGHIFMPESAAATLSALELEYSTSQTKRPPGLSSITSQGSFDDFTLEASSGLATLHGRGDGTPSDEEAKDQADTFLPPEMEHAWSVERQRDSGAALSADITDQDAHAQIATYKTFTIHEARGPSPPSSTVLQTVVPVTSPHHTAPVDKALLNLLQSRKARSSKSHANILAPTRLQNSMHGFLFQRLATSSTQKVELRPETAPTAENTAEKARIEVRDEAQENMYIPQSRHLYVASVRMLQNVAVLTELQGLQVDLVERDADDVDLILDPTSAVVFIRTSLLAESLQSPIASQSRHGIHRGWLRRLMLSDHFDKILVVCEQYTSSGLSVDITPPVQLAIDEFYGLLKSRSKSSVQDVSAPQPEALFGRPQFDLVFAKNAKQAASLCRQFADGLEQGLQPPAADAGPTNPSRSRSLSETTWVDRASWLRRSPTDGELQFSSRLNPVAAAFVAAAQDWIALLAGRQERQDALSEVQRVLGAERLNVIQNM